MIDYSVVEQLGFKRIVEPDKVYERIYGRDYFYMSFEGKASGTRDINTITFNWDCDSRDVRVFKNETELIAEFTDPEEFKQFFKMFQE